MARRGQKARRSAARSMPAQRRPAPAGLSTRCAYDSIAIPVPARAGSPTHVGRRDVALQRRGQGSRTQTACRSSDADRKDTDFGMEAQLEESRVIDSVRLSVFARVQPPKPNAQWVVGLLAPPVDELRHPANLRYDLFAGAGNVKEEDHRVPHHSPGVGFGFLGSHTTWTAFAGN